MLRCTVDGDYPVAVVRVSGRVDAAGVPELRTAVFDCLGTEPESVIVDFTAAVVGTDDCWTAVAALARQTAAWPGSALALVGVAGTATGVPEYRSVPAARAALATGGPPHRLCELFPAATVAAPLARRLITRACAEWSLLDLSDVAQLVVTELVANAVRHTGGDVVLVVSMRGGQFRISVADDDPRAPRTALPDPHDEHGRGLMMIESLGVDWGSAPVGKGKVVWARMAVPRDHPERPGRRAAGAHPTAM
jgi:anti-sigma regulatory factor (Ser/Thr protein kinase)